MASMTKNQVLVEAFGENRTILRQAVLIGAGIVAMVLAAKIRVPMWPVPMTLQTLAVLLIGTTFGARLGMMTLLGYLALGAAGVAVFAGESAGLAYMTGPTAGYLVGFAVAAGLMGLLARRGLDRSMAAMAGMMLAGSAVIYTFGLGWMSVLFVADKGFGWVLQYGMLNFLAGDLIKLAIAVLLVPGLWKMVRR